MARPRNPHPKLFRDKTRNQAACSFTDPATGKRRFVRLGAAPRTEADANHARLLANLRAGVVQTAPVGGATVGDLCVRFATHARAYYGVRSSEFGHHRLVLEILADRFDDLPAAAFGPSALKAVREDFVRRGWGRSYVNDQARRVRSVFRWAVGEELVPAGVWQALKAVPGLGRGRTAAPEREPVKPPPVRDVARALRVMQPAVAVMVRPSSSDKQTADSIQF